MRIILRLQILWGMRPSSHTPRLDCLLISSMLCCFITEAGIKQFQMLNDTRQSYQLDKQTPDLTINHVYVTKALRKQPNAMGKVHSRSDRVAVRRQVKCIHYNRIGRLKQFMSLLGYTNMPCG